MAALRLHRTHSVAPLALLVFALFLRVLVPAGWMPAEGQIGIRPCVPQAAAAEQPAAHVAHMAEAASHHAPKQDPDRQDHGEAQQCTFSLLAAALLAPPADEDDLAGPDYARAPAAVPDRAQIRIRLTAAPPPARGPPVHG